MVLRRRVILRVIGGLLLKAVKYVPCSIFGQRSQNPELVRSNATVSRLRVTLRLAGTKLPTFMLFVNRSALLTRRASCQDAPLRSRGASPNCAISWRPSEILASRYWLPAPP